MLLSAIPLDWGQAYCRPQSMFPMVLTAKQGGNQFWGCPTFPRCRGVVVIEGMA